MEIGTQHPDAEDASPSDPQSEGQQPQRVGFSEEEISAPYDQSEKHGRYIVAPDSAAGPPVGVLSRIAQGGDIASEVSSEVRRLQGRGAWALEDKTPQSFITEKDRATLNSMGGSAVNALLSMLSKQP
jgi:hypothetical protein